MDACSNFAFTLLSEFAVQINLTEDACPVPIPHHVCMLTYSQLTFQQRLH